METLEKSFLYWKQSELHEYLGLEEKENISALTNWLNADIVLSEEENLFLEKLLQYARPVLHHWNETELREKFITRLTNEINFDNYPQKLAAFSERKLEALLENAVLKVRLFGTIDWLVAKGVEVPKYPFFFIHEYKSEMGKVLDGRGQLLAAMVTAQALNQQPPKPTLFRPNPTHFYKDIPIYGAYVTGRFWFFVVLKAKAYSISKPYISTEIEDLQAIFKILKAQKQIIYSYLEEK